VRIAIVHNNPPGGAARATAETMRRLAGRGHTVDEWTLLPAPGPALSAAPQRTTPRGRYAPTLPLGGLSIVASPLGPLEALRLDQAWSALAVAVDAAGYDVVLTEGCQYVQQPRVHRRLRTPCVVYVHEVHRFVHERPREVDLARRALLAGLAPWHALLALAERAELRAARIVLANSRETASALRRLHGVEARVVHPGVDADLFRPLGLVRERVVLCPAALHRRKRQRLLIEALARIPRERRPRLSLIYASEGRGHVDDLRGLARAREVGLDLRQGVSDDELVHAYNRAALVAYVPEAEPFGLVPLEAMATGTPFVGAREGGLLETVEEGVTGVLVPAEAGPRARAVDDLLRDDAARARLSETGRARALERWSWERAVDEVEAALREAAGRSP
jgi:glycosyltransferase involved in cell wall biosynthesis